jgi:hypothetical protein
MRLTCPSCAAVHSAEAWANDPQARQCLLLVGELPAEVSRRVLQYLALFRNRSTRRAVSWPKALGLMGTLKDMITDPYIQWDREPARPNSPKAWADAMERMIQHPPRNLPLKNHNYLKRTAYEIANEVDRQVEVRKNRAERSGDIRPKPPPPAAQQPAAHNEADCEERLDWIRKYKAGRPVPKKKTPDRESKIAQLREQARLMKKKRGNI